VAHLIVNGADARRRWAGRFLKGVLRDGATSDRLFLSLPLHQTAGEQARFDGDDLKRALAKYGAPKDNAFHAWRHTVATWLRNKANASDAECGLVLNHASSGITAGYLHGHALDLK
jgi:integrase